MKIELIVLGLKRKSSGDYLIYDVTGKGNHIQIKLNESKKIKVLAPFPFSNYSSLDNVNELIYDKCYLKVNGDITQKEFNSMKSGGIVYYRFYKRQVTFIEEFHDIFQYSLQMLNRFGGQLDTYDLTTWVMHNPTKNELEYEAMKQIIHKALTDKNILQYPLDISLDEYTLHYLDVFREYEGIGREITFGRYGTIERDESVYSKIALSEENLHYLLGKNTYLDTLLVKHPSFTADFYNKYIANTKLEIELMFDNYENAIKKVLNKGLDSDEVYKRIFEYRLKQINSYMYDYDSFEEMLKDDNFEVYIEHHSPFDYYCCEDCDGYNIYERYTDKELEGYDVEVDSRVDYINELLQGWTDLLTEDSYHLFDFVPTRILEKVSGGYFVKGMLEHRKENEQ